MPIYQCKYDGWDDREFVDVVASVPHKAAENYHHYELMADPSSISYESVKVVVRSSSGETKLFEVESEPIVICTAYPVRNEAKQ